MKHLILLTFFAIFFCGDMVADTDGSAAAQINLQHKKHCSGHYEFPIPADEPDVYYDSVNQEIIIDGTGYVYYYDVEITSTTNWTVYIIAQVSGYYGTVDISSLPVGDYVITIDSPTGNSFEGFFDTY